MMTIIRAPLTLSPPIIANRIIHRKFIFVFAKFQEIMVPRKPSAKKVSFEW